MKLRRAKKSPPYEKFLLSSVKYLAQLNDKRASILIYNAACTGSSHQVLLAFSLQEKSDHICGHQLIFLAK